MSTRRLAKVLGKSEAWLEEMRRFGLPVARNVSTGEWWLSGEGQFQVWRQYANPPKLESEPHLPQGWQSGAAVREDSQEGVRPR